MAENIPPLASPIDPEKRREELAYLEGHDADIPTDDQTPGALIPQKPVIRDEEKALEHLNVSTGNAHHVESLPLRKSRSVGIERHDRSSDKTLGGYDEKSTGETNESAAASSGDEGPKQPRQAHDLEAGQTSSSTSHTETEIHVTEPPDPNVVWWDGPDDPENPVTWSEALKIGNVAVISMITFITQVPLMWLLRQIADYIRQTSSVVHVRSWRATSYGRVQIYEHPTCFLCCLGLHSRLRIRSLRSRPTVRAIRASSSLPRLQYRLRCLDCCLRCKQQPQHAHRLPISRRRLWICTLDAGRWLHSRYDHTRKERWYDGYMGHGSSSGTRGRSRCRRLLIASKGMAMGILVDYHSGEFRVTLVECIC